VLGGAVVAVGGFDADRGTLASVEGWRVGDPAWTPLPPLPIAVHHPAAGVLDGRLVVAGGYRGPGLANATDAVQVYDPATGAWSLAAPLPSPRGAPAAAVLDGRLVVVGGARDGTSLADAVAYDPTTDAWRALAPMPTGRDHLGLVAIDGRLHAVGGRDGTRDFALAAHEVYDPEGDRWSAAPPLPTGRSGHATAVLDGCLYALGGEGNPRARDGMFDAVERFDPVAGAWTRLAPMALPRHGAGVVAVDGALVVVGGAVVAGFGAVPVVDALVPPPCR
jgi:N-acetylneuraminic acid mutarotase